MTTRRITTIEICGMTWVSWDDYRALAAEQDELRQRAEKAEAALEKIHQLNGAELAWDAVRAKDIAALALRQDEGGE